MAASLALRVPTDEASPSVRFIARQPIFDAAENVFGYELLFRSGLDNHFTAKDGDSAVRDVADNYLSAATGTLTGGRKAFINCTREFLVNEYVTLLPKRDVVLEILETVEPDAEALAACRKLKALGYAVALDDFVYAPRFQPFVDLADIIKVDLKLSSRIQRKQMAETFAPRGIRMLAEKVETRAEFSDARESGYVYFQGFFFCKPQIVPARQIPAFKFHYLRILDAISREELNVDELVNIIDREISLCYKLLKFVNSALFGFRQEIRSTRHALALLGDREVKKWASVAAVVALAGNEPNELVLLSLARGRCGELLASERSTQIEPHSMFLLGIFSLMDVLLGRPMPELVSGLALPQVVRAALLGTANSYRDLLQLITSNESGRWDDVSALARRLNLADTAIATAYLRSLDWAQSVFRV